MPGRREPINPDNYIRVKKHLVNGSVLDVGAGEVKQFGWDTLDSNPSTNPDFLHDVEDGLPFDDESYTNTTAIHILEHIKDDLFLLDELKRVARKRVVVVIPIGERNDPDHRRTYMPEDLEKFDPDVVEQSRMGGLIDAVLVWKF